MAVGAGSWEQDLAENYARVASGRGDAATTFAPSGRLAVPGLGLGSGTFVGPQSIDAYFARLREACADSMEVTVDETPQLGKDTTTFWVRLVAHRGDATLSELQAVRVRFSDQLIEDAAVMVDDVRRYDAFWGGGPALLSPADGEILAKAFKVDATSPTSSGVAGILVAMVATFMLISAYTVLAGWRLAAPLEVHAQQLGALRGFTLASQSGDDTWRIDPSPVSALRATGPSTGTLDIRLPVGRASCADLAAAIGDPEARCASDGSLTVDPPINVSWSAPQELATVADGVPTTSVDVRQNPQGADGAVQIYSTSHVVVAFLCPQETVILTVADAGLKRWSSDVIGDDQDCPTMDPLPGAPTDNLPLTLRIGDPTTTGSPPFTLFGHVDGQFDGQAAQIDGFGGTVRILNTITPNTVPTRLSINGGDLALQATWDSRPDAESLQVLGSASTAVTDAGELVPSAWDRYPMFLVPLLGGLLAAFVVAPIGASASSLVATSQRALDFLTSHLRDHRERP